MGQTPATRLDRVPRPSLWERWRQRSRRRRFGRPGRAAPVAAGIAVVLSSTALAGVLQGYRWLWFVTLVVALVVVLGLVLRRLRVPTVAVVAGQLVGLVLLITGLFSKKAVLWVLPGPETLPELSDKLSTAIGVIEGGIPPVSTTTAMSLLVAACFGLMAVATDALAVAGDGPTASGLVLLGSFTVSTALTPDPLPDWTLATGAAGFALVLMTEHRRRQARRGVTSWSPEGRPAGPVMRRLRATRAAGTGVPVAVALTALALAAALGVGAVATVIGTEGRFPGNGERTDGSDGRFALNPFAALRGQLKREEPRELFRVRGLPESQYLRSLTLNRYVPQRGWEPSDRLDGVSMDETLPSGLPRPVHNPTATVQFENIDYRDRWLPLVGQPMGVTGTVPGRWHYDVTTSTAYTDHLVREPAWTERAALPDPSVAQLQATSLTTDVSPTYLDTSGVDRRIVAIAQAITKHARTPFERVVALNRYFLDPANGFHYSTQTRPGNTGDLLLDFLARSKTGYCEQFASAMAVMVRAVGIPSRVAVGFTGGQQVGDYRSVGTGDAHAWVEAYFPGAGWLQFDPTPLNDGRNITPNYVADAPNVKVDAPPASALAAGPGPGAPPSNTPPSPAAAAPPPPGGPGQQGQSPDRPNPGQQGLDAPHADGSGGPNQSGLGNRESNQAGAGPGGDQNGPGAGGDQNGAAAGAGGDQSGGAGGDHGGDNGGDNGGGKDNPLGIDLSAAIWLLLWVALGLLVVFALLSTPATIRAVVRRHRLAKAAEGGPEGADAAWRELLAEFQDRGGAPPRNATVRRTARRLARTHRLDTEAIGGMRTVVGAVEHGWYARQADPRLGPTLVTAVTTVRAGLDRSTPLTMPGRIWPRSVRPRRARSPR